MGNILGRLQRPFTAFSAERAHATSIIDRTVMERFRLPCSADVPTAPQNNQMCPIIDYLDICNQILFHVGLELRERRGGSLSLVSFEETTARVPPPADVDFYRTKTFLRWLIRTHVCITSLVLRDEWVTLHSEIILEELPDNNHIKKLFVWFPSAEALQTDISTMLPRLRFLEDLTLYYSPNTSAFVEAVSELLRTTTCLRCLALHSSYRGQPSKTLMDALTTNSILKTFKLWVNWHAAVPPSAVGNCVMSGRLLTELVVMGYTDDRQEVLLEECLVRNSTVSTLHIHRVCGGESTARFLTRILAECPCLKKLALRKVHHVRIIISDETMKLCTDALAANETLQEVMLPYSLWHPKNWLVFFDFLPRNTHLEKLEISHHDVTNSVRTADILEMLARVNSSPRVSFSAALGRFVQKLMHFRAFSSITLSGSERLKVRVLQRLPTLDHITFLWIDVREAGEPLFSCLASYIRSTTILRRLILTVPNPSLTEDTAPLLCWTLLSESLSTNTSIEHFDIYSESEFQYSDHLARSIGHSRSITRLTLSLNTPGSADEFLFHLSAALDQNYNLLKMDSFGVSVGYEAGHWLFRIRETMRRNFGLLERSVAYNYSGELDRCTATALEKVSRNPALVRELAHRWDIPACQAARMIRRRLRNVERLDDFMRLTGVVKEHVTCTPPVEDGGMQLQDLGNDCWRRVRRYLSFDDVRCPTATELDWCTSSRASELKTALSQRNPSSTSKRNN
ncbi:hypothetical protein MRX96_050753 [Rhipicephalus microplus]